MNQQHVMERINKTIANTASAQLIEARQRGLSAFAGTPHRMEFVLRNGGVDFVNDSASTFLDASLASLAMMDRPVVWIAGALPTGTAANAVQEFLRDRVAALVLFGDAATNLIDGLKPFTEHVYFAEEVRTSVFLARELARDGEVVLFSPACPSGPHFANYEERGHEFKRAVNDL